MSITPKGLARTLKSACDRRATVTDTEEIVFRPNIGDSAVSFDVYDNDGGTLRVTVHQYKEPVR
jgi:hypothetical protein